MTYKQIKWLILIIPTVTIGLWEFIRHEYLLPYISMELGNWLAPVIVFLVTVTLLRKLFAMMENMQEELYRERAANAALRERELIGRELHDGIAQSLFLLSVKVDRLERSHPIAAADASHQPYQELRKTVRQLNDYVRQAISKLRHPPAPHAPSWTEWFRGFIGQFREETGLDVHLQWEIGEERLAPKEKVELFSSIREALLNIHKHAQAGNVWVNCREEPDGWVCSIADDGIGYEGDPFRMPGRYGLKILRERAEEMGWDLRLDRQDGKTRLSLRKGGAA